MGGMKVATFLLAVGCLGAQPAQEAEVRGLIGDFLRAFTSMSNSRWPRVVIAEGDDMTATTSTLTPMGLTSADLSRGRLFLAQTRVGLTGSARMVTPAQWTSKSRPERWSIAEIVEHMIAVQELVIGVIRQQLASAPPPPSEQDRELVDSIVIHQFPSRLSKFPSPFTSTAELGKVAALRRYADNCAALNETLASTRGSREQAPRMGRRVSHN